jgi:hypothetical protein
VIKSKKVSKSTSFAQKLYDYCLSAIKQLNLIGQIILIMVLLTLTGHDQFLHRLFDSPHNRQVIDEIV